jgi:hypothetical protein
MILNEEFPMEVHLNKEQFEDAFCSILEDPYSYF